MKIQLDLSRTPFNLGYTLSCGQTFRWERREDWWIGTVSQTVLKIRQNEGVLEYGASSKSVDSDFLWRYFRLDDDLLHIYSRISQDEYVKDAVNQFRGLRLIRQEPWECLISFLCATYKNIPAIKQMIFLLCRRFGKAVEFDGRKFHTFPESDALAKATIHELKLCKLGFRAERILHTAKMINDGEFDLESLKMRSYEGSKRELMKLPGVGPKVADCILLFSLEKLEAFPIDVWMKRLILECYSRYFDPKFIEKMKTKNSLSPLEYWNIYDFGRNHFGEYVGYAQEYLYHHARCNKNGVASENLTL